MNQMIYIYLSCYGLVNNNIGPNSNSPHPQPKIDDIEGKLILLYNNYNTKNYDNTMYMCMYVNICIYI